MELEDVEKALKLSNGRGFHATLEGKKVVVVATKTFQTEEAVNLDTNLTPGGKRLVKKQKMASSTKKVAVLAGGTSVDPAQLVRV